MIWTLLNVRNYLRKELSVNLRTSMWNKLITADASFFINSNEGYLISSPTFYPSYLSTYYPAASFLPVLNYNNNRRIGFDFSVNVNKRIGEVEVHTMILRLPNEMKSMMMNIVIVKENLLMAFGDTKAQDYFKIKKILITGMINLS